MTPHALTINLGQPVNQASPLTRGLVGWWLALPNWNRGGSFRDLCNRYHGTLTNMDPATDWQGPQGRLGGEGALDFDGSGDHVVTGDMGTAFEGKFWTYNIWFSTTDPIDNRYPFSMGSTSNDLPLWGVRGEPGGSGKLQGLFRDNAGNLAITGVSSAVNDGRWRMLTLLADGSNLVMLIDGVFVNQYSVAAIGATSLNTSAIGALKRTSVAAEFIGKVDDAAAWNRALSTSEVLALYNDSRRGHPEMLNWIRPTWYVEQAGGGGGGLAIPIAAYHYNHHLGTMAG